MTTIVYKDGLMAADTRAWSGNKLPLGRKRKIHYLDDGSLLGISSCIVGNPERFLAFVKSLKGDYTTPFPEMLDVQAILVLPDGKAFYWNEGEQFSGPIENEHFAIGSGEWMAKTALLMGADPVKAVWVASQLDYATEAPIQTLRHTGETQEFARVDW